MADIRPFKGYRPTKEKAHLIAALPYDVYNREEAKVAAGDNPLSFLHIDRAEIDLPDETDPYSDIVYKTAREKLDGMIAEGDFEPVDEAVYYLYELTMQGRTQTGIVACSAVADYEKGVILRHENTRADKEEDRVRHVDGCNAQTGPIYLAYRRNDDIASVVSRVKTGESYCDFTTDGNIRHRVFVVDAKEDIETVKNAFSTIDHIYIADGHHRAASAVRVSRMHPEKTQHFLSVLFPDDELKIMDYNRVVTDLKGMSGDELRSKIEEVATPVKEVTDPIRPDKKGRFSIFLPDRWYLYEFKKEYLSDDPVNGLDVSILQDYILGPVLGIGDPKTDPRIDFVGGIRGLGELERRVHTDSAVAFAMYPTSINELFAVADAGLLMPPKSTWFEPKLLSGLFIHPLDGRLSETE
ncbi:MAG: DUF1015 domain-containing protein [Lachnospiraceae bacterium]|nr:DUF1015 domain-containing protein [Lachnospiraceae bacterium]